MFRRADPREGFNLTWKHRHLKLRTAGSHARVRELGSIRLFNVTSENVVRFWPNCLRIVTQVHGTMVANLVVII